MNYTDLWAAISILLGAAIVWRFYIWVDKRKRPWNHPCDCDRVCDKCHDQFKQYFKNNRKGK